MSVEDKGKCVKKVEMKGKRRRLPVVGCNANVVWYGYVRVAKPQVATSNPLAGHWAWLRNQDNCGAQGSNWHCKSGQLLDEEGMERVGRGEERERREYVAEAWRKALRICPQSRDGRWETRRAKAKAVEEESGS